MDIFYIDGEFVPAEKAALPVNDLAIIRGYGVFDFLKTYGGRPFLLAEHLQRLQRSADEIGLVLPWSQDELAAVVWATLAKNKHEESAIRIVVTGGPTEDFITPLGQPRLLVLVTPLQALPEWWFSEGIKIITVPIERDLPGAKSINYLPATMAIRRARKQGAVEAVFVNREGHAKEGTTSNIFAFFGDTLVTPADQVLPGITRQVVLQITAGLFNHDLRDIRKTELLQADELFITGSSKGLVPVVNVDGTTIGSGKPGPRTQTVMKRLDNYVKTSNQQIGKNEPDT